MNRSNAFYAKPCSPSKARHHQRQSSYNNAQILLSPSAGGNDDANTDVQLAEEDADTATIILARIHSRLRRYFNSSSDGADTFMTDSGVENMILLLIRQSSESHDRSIELQAIIDDLKKNTINGLHEHIEQLERKLYEEKQRYQQTIDQSTAELDSLQRQFSASEETVRQQHSTLSLKDEQLARMKEDLGAMRSAGEQLRSQIDSQTVEYQQSMMEVKRQAKEQSDQLLADVGVKLNRLREEKLTVQRQYEQVIQDYKQQIADLVARNELVESECQSYQNLLHEQVLQNGQLHLPVRGGSGNDCQPCSAASSASLSDELSSATAAAQTPAPGGASIGELQGKVRALEDDNRSLLLYINRILSRILECGEDTMDILSSSN